MQMFLSFRFQVNDEQRQRDGRTGYTVTQFGLLEEGRIINICNAQMQWYSVGGAMTLCWTDFVDSDWSRWKPLHQHKRVRSGTRGGRDKTSSVPGARPAASVWHQPWRQARIERVQKGQLTPVFTPCSRSTYIPCFKTWVRFYGAPHRTCRKSFYYYVQTNLFKHIKNLFVPLNKLLFVWTNCRFVCTYNCLQIVICSNKLEICMFEQTSVSETIRKPPLVKA